MAVTFQHKIILCPGSRASGTNHLATVGSIVLLLKNTLRGNPGCAVGPKTLTFSSYEKNHDPQRAITFGDGNQGLVKGLGKIAISPDHFISNVFLVDSLDYNLLFVSQLCKMGYNCLFTDIGVTVF